MKKIIVLLAFCLTLLAEDIIVFENEYKVLQLDNKVKKLVVGNKEIMNISILGSSSKSKTTLKLFGKKSGNTSILITYRDNSIQNFHVYINQNLGFIQKMINTIEPNLALSKVGDGSTVISGKFRDPHEKKRIYKLLVSAGIDLNTLMDITSTNKINKMIRTKLYLVEINNNRAKDLGGVTGLSYFSEYGSMAMNGAAANSATFSGWLLDNVGAFSTPNGGGLVGSLNFLQSKGIAKILDDTVLITTEDKNASFHVGGKVYIPVGMTQGNGGYPMIQLEEKEYGLRLTLKTDFLEKENYMHVDVNIEDSQFDPNKDHDIQLGTGGFGSDPVVVPSFLSKDISTDVVAKSGSVIALGGRLHNEDIDIEEKIPFLGDIPIIGALFTHTVKSKKQNDLLFFLVPEIVDANEDIDDSHFYRDFKEESLVFNDGLIDVNSPSDSNSSDFIFTEEEVSADENTTSSAVVIEYESAENNITTNVDADKIEDVQINTPIIVTEDIKIVIPKESVTTSQVEEGDVDDNKSEVVQEELLDAEPIAVEPSIKNEVVVEKAPIEETKSNALQQYKVKVKNIYVRSKPQDGYPAQVWAQGHPFTVESEEVVDSHVWMKIKQDCKDECTPVKEELWISKKYTEEL